MNERLLEMKKLILFAIFAVFLVGCEEEKNFEVPALTGRVVDTANVLSNEEKTQIENAILNFEKNTKGQFAVCVVPNINGETIESASIKIAEKWKIGKKGEDNGIIFLLSMKEREFRIEVAYGFEGKLNDAKAGDLGRLAIPYFKNKKWGEGIVVIVNGSSSILSGKQTISQLKESEEDKIPLWVKIAVAIFIIIIFVIIVTNSDRTGTYLGGSSYRGGGGYGGGGGFSGGGGSFGGGGFSGKF